MICNSVKEDLKGICVINLLTIFILSPVLLALVIEASPYSFATMLLILGVLVRGVILDIGILICKCPTPRGEANG